MGQEQQDSGSGEVGLDSLPLSAPSTKPILLTSQEEIGRIRGRLSEPAVRSLYDAVQALALSNPAEVTSPMAAAADVDPLHSDVGWQLLGLESVLPAAGVVWRLSGDRRCLDHAAGLIETALAWRHWSDGRHLVVDGYYDAAPETASGIRALAWALDLFADDLPDRIERAARKSLAYHAQRLTEISSSGAIRWSANPFDDWSADIHSAIGHAALVLYGADDRAEGWLRRAVARITAYLDCLPPDGGHPSGISRWEFALTHCCQFIEALYRFSGFDLRRHPSLERTRRFAVRCLAPGGQDIVQIDQALPLRISGVTRGPLSKLLAKWFDDPVLGWALLNTADQSYVEAQDLLWFDDSAAQTPPGDAGEGSAVFPDIGWAVMRSGWGGEDNMIAFQCTPYWPGYHHLDQGTFEIFVRGRELVLDSGLGWRGHPNYFDRYRDSLAHNVVLIDGKGQLRHTREAHGEMLAMETGEHADYAAGECSAAYENVERFTREVLFLKPDVIIIRDVIRLDRPRNVEWLMHGGGSFEVRTRLQDRGFSLRTEDAFIEAFVLQPERWNHLLRRGYKLVDWQTRHEVTHPVMTLIPEKAAETEILIVLRLGSADQARKFPGTVTAKGALQLQAGANRWRIVPSAERLEYHLAGRKSEASRSRKASRRH